MSLPLTPCRGCGELLPTDFRFCGYCGKPRETNAVIDEPAFYSVGLAERRQLTVLFCDLCSSMLIIQLLDQEDMRELIRRYQNLCQEICERYGGYISRYIGDGIVVFFGFPNPLEDAAERAIDAGLDMVSTIESLELHREFGLQAPVRIRVGIATGEVVIGDEIGEGASKQHIAIGLAPSLAARIQEFADPGVVMISDETHAVVGRRFDCRDRGMQSLKNVLEPVRCWQVEGRNEALNRFDSRIRLEESRFFGRGSEIEYLVQAWQDIERGFGRSVIVSGAPGIGKSRLVRELLNRITGSQQFLVYQCVASRQNTALHPFINLSDDYLSESGYTQSVTVAESAGTQLSAWKSKQQALGTGVDIARAEVDSESAVEIYQRLKDRVSIAPSIVVFEDIQWIDPTSLEVLGKLRSSSIPVLLLITSRTDDFNSLQFLSNSDQLQLDELNNSEKSELVDELISNSKLPPHLKQEILDRSGGTPLFLEEMTKAALAQQDMSDSVLNGEASIVVPYDIKDALFTQLGSDKLTRAVVQYASVIGSVFIKKHLLEVLPGYVSNTDERLDSLVSQGVLYRGDQQDSFSFRHELLRETAYGSLLKQERQRAHLALAKAYTEGVADSDYADLEIIARHFTRGGASTEAIEYHIKAGQIAARISANIEAVNHYERGLQLLKSADVLKDDLELELQLQVGLAASLIFTKGPGSLDVRNAYSKAMELCNLTVPSELHFAAYWGWWKISYDFDVHKERADDILDLSQELNNSQLLMQAHHCQWATQFYLGNIESCCRHIRDGLAEYDSESHLSEASLYGGHDAKVCALGELALSQWLSGALDKSAESMKNSLSWARQSGHAGSIAHAMDICLMLLYYNSDYQAMKNKAEAIISFSEKHKSPDHLAKGYIYYGWASAKLGENQSGFELFLKGTELQRDIGTREDFAVFDCMRAQFYLEANDSPSAIELLDKTLHEANTKRVINFNSEIIRHRAVAQSLAKNIDTATIRSEFRKAEKIAEDFGMKSLKLSVLKTAIEFELSIGLVSPEIKTRFNALLSTFTEGFSTKLIQSSKNLRRKIS